MIQPIPAGARALRTVAALALLALLVFLTPACTRGVREIRPGSAPANSDLLSARLADIDRLADIGRIREAIAKAELALVDHYHSEELRDCLAELRSIRQVLFVNSLEEARSELGSGRPRTALAILSEVNTFGDAEMLREASGEREKIFEAHPALLDER